MSFFLSNRANGSETTKSLKLYGDYDNAGKHIVMVVEKRKKQTVNVTPFIGVTIIDLNPKARNIKTPVLVFLDEEGNTHTFERGDIHSVKDNRNVYIKKADIPLMINNIRQKW